MARVCKHSSLSNPQNPQKPARLWRVSLALGIGSATTSLSEFPLGAHSASARISRLIAPEFPDHAQRNGPQSPQEACQRLPALSKAEVAPRFECHPARIQALRLDARIFLAPVRGIIN